MKQKTTLLITLMSLMAALAVYAQSGTVRVTISHAFSAAGKQFPAGPYQFARDPVLNFIRLTSTDRKNSAQLPILTRTSGAMHTTSKDGHVVFDKIGETYVLSELWIPGQDGYVLNATKEKHEHQVMDDPNK